VRDEKNQPADEKETVSGAPGPDKLTSADAATPDEEAEPTEPD
jgi:hypothetical protein